MDTPLMGTLLLDMPLKDIILMDTDMMIITQRWEQMTIQTYTKTPRLKLGIVRSQVMVSYVLDNTLYHNTVLSVYYLCSNDLYPQSLLQ